MESMGKKRPRPRRSFTPEFKAEIIELCQRGDRTLRQVSQDFDLTETAVREWVKQAELDTGVRVDGLSTDERAELAQLRKENRRLREDVDVLKRATAFFALGRPGEQVSVHRGGAGRQAQRQRACELLKVSRSAYYQHARGEQSTRARVDVQLTEQTSPTT